MRRGRSAGLEALLSTEKKKKFIVDVTYLALVLAQDFHRYRTLPRNHVRIVKWMYKRQIFGFFKL